MQLDESDRLTVWLLAKCLTSEYVETVQWSRRLLWQWRKFQATFLFPLLSILRRVWNRLAYGESSRDDNLNPLTDPLWKEFLYALHTTYQEKQVGFAEILHYCHSCQSSPNNISEEDTHINVNRGEHKNGWTYSKGTQTKMTGGEALFILLAIVILIWSNCYFAIRYINLKRQTKLNDTMKMNQKRQKSWIWEWLCQQSLILIE